MSTSQVVAVFERATNDLAFRQLLFNNPDEALQGYELTASETEVLSNLNEGNFETVKGQWIPGG